jgi:hypothetical protein
VRLVFSWFVVCCGWLEKGRGGVRVFYGFIRGWFGRIGLIGRMGLAGLIRDNPCNPWLKVWWLGLY